VTSLALIGLGMLLFARTPVQGGFLLDVLPPTILVGLGTGLGFPALMTLAMSGATPSDAGLASGLVNTSAQVGGAIGLAALATVAAAHTQGRLSAGESAPAALNAGYHVAYLIGAALVAVAIAITFAVLRKPGTAEEAADEEPDLAAAA
jgi:MFS family permease